MKTIHRQALVVLAALLASSLSAHAAATIQITSPQDQAFVNATGGPPDLVEVTYQVTGNTCTGFKSSFSIVPYVNGVAVSCGGSGCGCDGATESCNNITKTITLDGNSFSSCLNTIQLSMNPAPYTPPLCITPGSAIFSNTVQVWQDPYKTCTGPGDCNKSTVGRPVDVATGKMYHEMTDLRIQGPLPLEFVRRYDSQSTFNGAMGFGWQHAYQMRIEPAGTNRQVFVDRTGRRIYFARNGQGAWQENLIEHLTLAAPGSPAWRVTDRHQTKYEFEGAGKLTRIADRNNNQITFGYTGSNLTSITDTVGRVLTLAYDGNNRLQTLSAGGRTVTYTYNNSTSNLTRVDWSDGSFVTYEYTDPGDTHNLTAARDSFGNLIEGHTYDGSDRVLTTQSDAGNYAYTLSYDSSTQTTVTNSRGIDTVYTHDSFNGLVTSSTGPGCTSCGGGGINASLQYDRYLNLTRFTDAVGVITDMTYDGKGNVLTRVEAVGTPRQRTWTYTYHATFNFPATITIPTVGTCGNPNKVVTHTYSASTGDRLTEQVTGCAGSATFSRTTTYSYDAHGQVRTIDGPRTDVSDVTTYDYYPDGDPDLALRGRLQRVTNALGHQTTYAGYDLFGNVGSVTDANNVETAYLYDEKDRVTETRVKGATSADDIVTENHYDLEGNLDFVRLPNCVETGAGCAFSLDYVYDTVNRLTEIHDPFGNKIVYSYDTEGNRTREESRDGSEVVQRFTNFAYDDFNRLRYTYFNSIVPENPGSLFFKYAYFDDGQRQSERDPEGHVTTFAYDELKRLTTVTQTVGVDTLTTAYGYDVQDNLSSVTDPNGLVTTYTNHDMGWRLRVDSPDTGTTTYIYDPAGNLTSTTTANGVTSNRNYDALDRLTFLTYPDSSLNVTQSYDSGAVTFGIGRRTGMTDASGSTVYGYDRRGLPTREEKTIGSATYVTQYAYDKTGNPTQILYPTDDPGLRQGQVDYTYDAADRVTAVTAKVNGATTTVASSIAYKPFGPRTSLMFGNGLGTCQRL
jgi:YD repeat-containing protein